MIAQEKGENFEQSSVDTEQIKCDSCGSNLVFDPKSQMLYCEHCGTKKLILDSNPAEELNLINGLMEERDWSKEENNVFACENCGAKVVLSKGESAKLCPFCGTAHVTKTEELAGVKPNAVLPFTVDKENALEFTKRWAKKRLYAPRKFKKNMGVDNVNGVYAPCFTFDSYTTSIYYARIGTEHTRTVGSGKNRRVETYIVWRNVSGTYYSNFDDILVSAGSKLGQDKLNKLCPYDTNNGREYQEKYLLGFMAYHYDHDIEDCWGNAKNYMDAELKKLILKQYHYDVLDYINISTQHENVTYKYVMLPVYVGNFNYNKKLYNFYVNGTNGKVVGKTPVSPWKVLLTVGLGILVAAAVGLIVYFFGQ